MPLSITDAERTLNLLWDFKQYVEGDEESNTSLNAAISLLTGYCTEILPVITKNGVSSGSTAVVELECAPDEKLGICLDSVTLPLCSYSVIMISLIKPASISDKSGLLRAGDQVLKINGHSLMGSTLRRARWLLETAQRSRRVVLEVISSALKSNLKHSRTLPPSPFTMEPPPAKRTRQDESVTVTAEVENAGTSIRRSSRSFGSRRSSSSSIHNHPSYAPSIGSRRSSQIAITSTVEVAAHIAREAMQPSPSGLLGTKKRKVHKIHLLKGKRSLGLNIIGGKGSKYGDVGIFIKEILVDGAAYRDGRLKVNDELLMANGRSLVGMTHNEADLFLKSLPGMVQLVVATESMHASGQTSMCSSRFSLSSIQERHVQNSISPLVTHTEQNSPIESAHNLNESVQDSANGKAHNSDTQTSLEKSKDVTTSSRVPHQLLDTDTNDEDGIISTQHKTFTTNIKHSETPVVSSESLSQCNREVTVGKKNRKLLSDSTDYAPKKEKSSSSTFKVLKIFKKNKSKANVHVEKQDDDMEMAELELSLGKSLESETTSIDDEHKSLSPSGMSGDLKMVTPWARLSSSSLSQGGNMPPSPPVKTIVIPRSQNKKLGIALGQSKDGSGLPFVKSLDPDGSAAKDGRVRVGNFIVKVNNQELVNHSAKDAASIIRAEFAKYGMVSLVISKGRKQVFSTSSITKGTLITVLLTNDAKFGLGLELAKLAMNESDNDYDIVIQKVTSAENAKCVQRGDQILEVNGLSLVGIAIENVDKIFKRIKPGKVPLKLMRPANPTAVIIELDKLSDNKSLQPATSLLVNSYKGNENIKSDEIVGTSHVGVSDTHPDTIPPSSDEQAKTSSLPSLSVSHHSSTPDSVRPPVSLAKISKDETGVNRSTEDILRRLHRHPSINTVKRELIVFEKGSARMGIEVVAGDKTPHRGALVIRVFPDCIAGLEGKLKCGDEILEVSGKSIIGMTHSEVISLLKKSIGQVTMLVSRSSQVLNSHSGSETSLLDDFYATEKLKSANASSIQNSLDDLKSSAKASLHSIRQEEYSEDELDDAPPIGPIQQSGQGSNDNVITIQYSDSSMFSTGHRTSVMLEEDLPPLPSSSPPAHETLSVGPPLHLTHKDILKEIEEDGPPAGYSVLMLEIQRISKGKLTIVPCQKMRESYFMVRRFAANLKEGSIKPGDILVSLNGSPLYGIPLAQVLQSLNEAPKQSKLEIYRDPDYKLDSVYSPRVSYSRGSYTGSRSSLVFTDDSPQLESRKGSFTDFDSMSNRGSSRRSSRKLSGAAKRSFELSNSLKRYSSQEMSSPITKQRPSSLSSFASVSTIVAKQSASSVVSPLPTITPKCSAESSPVAAHRSPSPIGYPINTIPSTSDVQEPAPLTPEDTAKAVSVSDGEHHDIPMETFNGDQAEKVPDTNSVNDAVAETNFMEKKKPISILFGSRSETGPFEIEVTKGFWGLGVTVDCDKMGAIFVKALTSRSPLNKDGNIKVGDHLLSINDEALKSLVETEQILKKLPKGPVKIVALPPPLPTDEKKNDDWSQYILSPSEDTVSDKGIITVEFNRPKSIPLGLNIAGGSDMPQKMVYIHSITPGSLADTCNKFRVGDEIVMVGNDLMVGLTWKAASDKINQLVGLFKIVAQRRETVVAKSEEKHQEEEKTQENSFKSDSGDKSISRKKEPPAPISTNTPQLSRAVEAAAQQDSEDNKVTSSPHPDHKSGDESITFTVTLNRPKNVPLGLNVAGGCDMLQKVIYIHSITPGSLADKCNKFKVGDEIVMAGNTAMAGLTWKSASAKVNKLVGTFKIVAKRRNGSKQQERSPDDFPDGPQPIKLITQHQDSFNDKSENQFSFPTAPELPSSAPPKPSSSPPGQDAKVAHRVSVDSFDSESGDEFLLQQESGIPSTNIPLQNTKPAHTISMDSFDSESGDEELLLKETFNIPPNPPPRVPPEPLPIVTKPAQAISMDSFDSESGDEFVLEQGDTLGAPPSTPPPDPPSIPPPDPPSAALPDPPSVPPPDPPSAALPDPPSIPPPDPPSIPPPDPPSIPPPDPPSIPPPDPPTIAPPQSAELMRRVSVDSFDSESGDEFLLQQEMLGVPPKYTSGPPKSSSGPPKPPPRVPPKGAKLDSVRTKVHKHKQSDNNSGDESRLEQKEKLGSIQLSPAAKLSKNSVSSESDDETFVSQEETFTVVFNKDANTQLGISIKEDIDTTNGIGIRGIKKNSLADRDGRLQPGNKLLSVNGTSLCGLTYKKTLELLRNAGNELKIVATRPAVASIRKPITYQSSIDGLSDNEEAAEAVKVGEEKFTVEFHKEGKSKLGVTITGGIDTPTGDVGIKNIVKGSLADKDGRLQQGDKLLSVNGISLSNVTNREALEILRGVGNHITIVAVRYVGVDKLKGTPLSSTVPSLTSSRNQSPRASRKALHDQIPEIPTPRRKMSKHFQPGKSTKSTSSLHESGHHTLPRDFGTVKAIELRKGAQGLGMQLVGGIDINKPVTVKEVFQGGAAHQSSKISKGDQILEINGKSFARLTHREVIELIKNEPEGKVTLLVKFASRNK